MPMLSRTLEETLHRAIGYARERNHEYATLEHLLLALGDDSDAIAVLRACAVDVKKLRADVAEYVESEFETVDYDDADAPDPKPTAGFQRVLQRAAIHVQSSGREEVNGANVLVAIFSERESHAVYFLHLQEMTRLDAVQYYLPRRRQSPGRSERRRPSGEGSRRELRIQRRRQWRRRARGRKGREPKRWKPIALTSTKKPLTARSIR